MLSFQITFKTFFEGNGKKSGSLNLRNVKLIYKFFLYGILTHVAGYKEVHCMKTDK